MPLTSTKLLWSPVWKGILSQYLHVGLYIVWYMENDVRMGKNRPLEMNVSVGLSHMVMKITEVLGPWCSKVHNPKKCQAVRAQKTQNTVLNKEHRKFICDYDIYMWAVFGWYNRVSWVWHKQSLKDNIGCGGKSSPIWFQWQFKNLHVAMILCNKWENMGFNSLGIHVKYDDFLLGTCYDIGHVFSDAI